MISIFSQGEHKNGDAVQDATYIFSQPELCSGISYNQKCNNIFELGELLWSPSQLFTGEWVLNKILKVTI